jgi:hypothetical protein
MEVRKVDKRTAVAVELTEGEAKDIIHIFQRINRAKGPVGKSEFSLREKDLMHRLSMDMEKSVRKTRTFTEYQNPNVKGPWPTKP